jgi:hypothetical protein
MSTDGFGKSGAELLANKLEKLLGYEFPVYQKKKGKDLWVIKASTKPALAFIEYINPVFNFGMSRKSDIWAEFVKPIERQIIVDGGEELPNQTIDPIRNAIYDVLLSNKECEASEIQNYLMTKYNLSWTICRIHEKCRELADNEILDIEFSYYDGAENGFPRNVYSMTKLGRKYAKLPK